jgi:hypothetical protein
MDRGAGRALPVELGIVITVTLYRRLVLGER